MTYWCIYKITNNINGKTYIGQHKYTNEDDPMGKYTGSGLLIHRAYEKYGLENFSTEVLYKRIQYKETADSMEIWAIEKERKENKNGCYNLANGGGGIRSADYPEEVRQKISNTLKGHPGHPMSEENKRKMSERMKGNKYGSHPCSDEAKKKISKANKGRKGSSYFSILNKERTGKPLSEEHKQKISKSHKGKNTWAKNQRWFTNGEVSTFTFECPEGFWPGRTYKRRGK